MVNYGHLQKHTTDFLVANNAWDRAVSVDIEADLKILDDFGKIVLSISTARRVDGKVEIKKFIVEEESLDEEVRIFNEFGSFCAEVKPLVLVGYNIGRFDLPVFLVKTRRLDSLFKDAQGKYKPGYWAFRDATTQSYILDVLNQVKFEIANHDKTTPRFVSLEAAIAHQRFKHLPFKNTKRIVSGVEGDKWDVIRNLWQNDRKKFEEYIEGDVHDTLLLAEDIFGIKK